MVDADYTEPRAIAPRSSIRRYVETPVVILALVAGAAFLTKMCYLSLAFNTISVIIFLALVYLYVRTRFKIQIPILLLGLVFVALQVDALGNFFHMYGHQFGPMQYDEFGLLLSVRSRKKTNGLCLAAYRRDWSLVNGQMVPSISS